MECSLTTLVSPGASSINHQVCGTIKAPLFTYGVVYGEYRCSSIPSVSRCCVVILVAIQVDPRCRYVTLGCILQRLVRFYRRFLSDRPPLLLLSALPPLVSNRPLALAWSRLVGLPRPVRALVVVVVAPLRLGRSVGGPRFGW